MDIQLLAVLYRVGAYLAPTAPDHPSEAWEEAIERGLILLSWGSSRVTPAGEAELRAGLQAFADGLKDTLVARTMVVGGLLAVAVTKSTLSAPATWWAVQRTFHPITGHMVRVDLRMDPS